MLTTMRAAEAQPWAGAGHGSGSSVLAGLVLGERPESALDLSDPPLELLDQPFPPPPQPPDRSTNIAQREQPCLCLFHEALLSAADHAVGQCPAARATKRQTKLADSSTRRTGTPWPAHRDDPKTVKN